MKRIFFTLITLASILFSAELFANDPFYTYAGGFIACGMNNISYSDWIDNETKTQDVKGYNLRAGLMTVIFVNIFAGEFGVSGSFNFNDAEETNIYSADWYGLFKFVYKFNDKFALATGPGLYMESIPSTKHYDGGGLQYSLGSYISAGKDWKIATDIFFRYGYFGLGEDSTKMNYGFQLSVTKKVGNL